MGIKITKRASLKAEKEPIKEALSPSNTPKVSTKNKDKEPLNLPMGVKKVSIKKVNPVQLIANEEEALRLTPEQEAKIPEEPVLAKELHPRSNGKFKQKHLPQYGKAKEEFSGDDLGEILQEGDEDLSQVIERSGGRATSEQLDYRRRQILRLLLRGVPNLTIAEYLKIPAKTLEHDIKEIRKQTKKEITNLDYPLFIGMTVNFYDEARNIALRLATDTKEKSNLVKMRALDVALRAEDSKHKYLQMVGLYKTASPIEVGAGEKRTSDADDFLLLLESATQGQTIDAVYEEIGLTGSDT